MNILDRLSPGDVIVYGSAHVPEHRWQDTYIFLSHHSKNEQKFMNLLQISDLSLTVWRRFYFDDHDWNVLLSVQTLLNM